MSNEKLEMRNAELKLCPNCGSKNISHFTIYYNGKPREFLMKCKDCWFKTSKYATEQEAVEAWNTRFEAKETQEVQCEKE